MRLEKRFAAKLFGFAEKVLRIADLFFILVRKLYKNAEVDVNISPVYEEGDVLRDEEVKMRNGSYKLMKL